MDLKAHLSLNTAGLTGPLGGARSALEGFTGMLKNTLGPLAAITAGLAGVATVGEAFKRSISAAAADESLEARLAVLMKSTSAAKEMLGQMNKFSEATPFEPEPIQKAAIALIGAKFAAKDVLPLLRDLGDLSAGHLGDMGQNLNEITEAMSRMKSGGGARAMEVLRTFSIGEDDLKSKGVQFDAGGGFKSSAETAINAVRAVIQERFGGTMDLMAHKTEGLFSTLKGNVTAVFREFGKPMLAPLEGGLNAMIGSMDSLKAKAGEAGQFLAGAFGAVKNAAGNGDLGEALMFSVKIGLAEGVNYGAALLNASAESFGILLAADIKEALTVVEALGTADFWKGMGDELHAAALGFVSVLERGLAGALEGLGDVKGLGFLKDTAKGLRKEAAADQAQAGGLVNRGAKLLEPLFQATKANIVKTTAEITEAFKDNLGKVPQLIDDSGDKEGLRQVLARNLPGLSTPEAPGPQGNVAAFNVAAAAEATKHGAKAEDGDRLTKIGLLVGSHQDSMTEHARRTAENTTRLVTGVLKITALLTRNQVAAAQTAVFGE